MSPWIGNDIRAVFFDAVGTIIHPSPPAIDVYLRVAEDAGHALDPADLRSRFRRAFAIEEAEDHNRGWVTSEAREQLRWKRIVMASLNEVADPGTAFETLFQHFGSPSAWVVDSAATSLFKSLQSRGIKVGLGSNFDRRLRSVIHGHTELQPIIDRIVISSEVGRRKPSPLFFKAITLAAGCSASEILFVGDDPGNDYMGAAEAGFKSLLLDPTHQHTDVVSRISALAELITP